MSDAEFLEHTAEVLNDPDYRVVLKTQKAKPEVVQLAPLMAEVVALRLREIATKLRES